VAEMGYRPQSPGRTLVRGQSDLVLLMFPIAASGRIDELVNALTESLAHGLPPASGPRFARVAPWGSGWDVRRVTANPIPG
jgi:hypothetical protein